MNFIEKMNLGEKREANKRKMRKVNDYFIDL